MISARSRFSLAIVLLFVASFAKGQAATGTPPFSSIEGGPDVVNLGNLNIHMAYPVLHKAGRQVSLSYDLTNDSSFWFPVTVNGSTFWNPVQTGGWSGSPQGVGNLYFAFGGDGFGGVVYLNFSYYDSAGTGHPFSLCVDSTGALCPVSASSTTVDGSGYTLSADACFVINNQCNLVVSMTSADGNSIVPQNGIPLNNTVTPGSVIDRNGNEITTDSSGNVTDTLGLQNGKQTLRASGGNGLPYVLSYTSPATTDANVTVSFQFPQVRTNFGCPGITEYGGTNGLQARLVDKITLPDGTFYQFTYEVTPFDTHTPHHVTGRVASIKLPAGGVISYDFSVGGHRGIMCVDGSTSGVKRTTPDSPNGWTYTRSLGTGAASTTTVVDPKGNTTLIQFQGIYETQRKTYQGAVAAANLLQSIDTCYNGAAIPCTATAIALPVLSRTAQTQLGPNTAKVISKKVYTYNIYGLMTEEDDYDWGATAPGALLKKSIVAYATDMGAIKNLPASVTIQNGSGATMASVAMTYDEGTPALTTGTPQHATFTCSPPLPAKCRGNLTTLATTANGTTTLYRKFTYYDTGNPNTSTAVSTSSTVNGATTTYNYAAGTASCGNSFATSVSEPLSLSRSMTWDCVGGVQLTATDENGKVTSSTYTDASFWRPSKTTDATLVDTLLTYSGANVSESTLTFNSGNSIVDIVSTLDGLGRSSLAQVKQSPTSSTYDTTETDYDAAGLTLKSTLPFAGSLGVTNGAAAGTITSYDGLNRPVQKTDSGNGVTSYTYTKNDVLLDVGQVGPPPTGENDKRRQMEYDALGRLTSVCELTTAAGSGNCAQSNPQTGFWTKYTYDANGNLTGVTQNAQAASGQQTRSYAYDRLSRVTSETNPESGTVAYTYDSDATCGSSTNQAGQLVKRVDALNNVTCYNYDALHRSTTITYPSGPYAASTPTKTFVYDSTTFGCAAGSANANVKTRLAEAYTGPSNAKITDLGYCYTPRGEIADVFESTPNSGGYYHIPFTYWENGLLKSSGGFLGQEQLGYIPDGEGRPYSTKDITDGNTIEHNSTTYNAASQPTQLMTSCAGATCYPITYQYDPNTLRMTQYSVALATGTIAGALTWNPNGSLQKLIITNTFNTADAQTCTYSADDLGRIASANCGSNWAQTFSYDPFSNVTKSGSISWMPGYNTSTNRYTLGGTSYDANGNLLNDTFHAFTWDAEGKPLSVDYGGGQTRSFIYDAFGHRVEEEHSGLYNRSYLNVGKIKYSAYGQSANYSEFPLPGGNSYSQGGGLTGLHLADWLSTLRAAWGYTGGSYIKSGAHAPFGEAYGYGAGYPDEFTGQQDDGSTVNATHYFPERQYRSNQGRWLSPDPAGMGAVDPSDPQSWNRYAYVRNSPLTNVDPQGLDDWGDDWGGGWGGGDWGGWGGDSGGWFGTINISWGGGGVNVGFSGFGGGCSGESLGVPCGGSLNDPLAGQVALARQMIIAAVKGNWKAVLGLYAGALSQDLWDEWNKPGHCNPICEDGSSWENFKKSVRDWYWRQWPKPALPNMCNKGETRIKSITYAESSTGKKNPNINTDTWNEFQSEVTHTCEATGSCAWSACGNSGIGPTGQYGYCDLCSSSR